MDPLDISWEVDAKTGEGKYTAKVIKRKARRSFADDDLSDLDDFIVNDDEVDGDAGEYKPGKSSRRHRGLQKRIILSDDEDEESEDELEALRDRSRQKSKAVIDLDSDDDTNEPPARTKVNLTVSKKNVDPLVQPAMMSSFLPSTKMQYMMKYVKELAEKYPDDKVCALLINNITTYRESYTNRRWSFLSGLVPWIFVRTTSTKTTSATFASKET